MLIDALQAILGANGVLARAGGHRRLHGRLARTHPWRRARRAVNDAAAALGGTFGAEHGIGRTLTGDMARYKPPVEVTLMRAVKQAFDPRNLFNPGKLLPASNQAHVR